VFPVNARFHILGTGERGGFKRKTAVADIEQLLRRSPPWRPRAMHRRRHRSQPRRELDL
jgi:hypothetical protein